MACMDNYCTRCGHEWMDNVIQTICSQCQSHERENSQLIIRRRFDEFPGEIPDMSIEGDIE